MRTWTGMTWSPGSWCSSCCAGWVTWWRPSTTPSAASSACVARQDRLLSSFLGIVLIRAHRLNQQQKDSALKNQFLAISTHWTKQMYKINYWHQYTIDAVQSFRFLRRNAENCKNMLNYYNNDVSFALLNGWNVTKTSFDYAWARMEKSCLWTQINCYVENLGVLTLPAGYGYRINPVQCTMLPGPTPLP